MNDQSKTKHTRIQKKASLDNALEYAESIINTVREPLIILDHDLKVITASRSFYDFFKVNPKETVGQFIYDLGNKQWDIPELRELLETILPQKTTFDNYEVEHDFAAIGRHTMLLNARQIKRALGKERIILLAIEDITERKRLEGLLTESEERYRHLFETASDGIVLLEKHEGKIINTNPAAEKMLGYSKKDSIGNKLQDIGILDIDDFPLLMHNLNKDGIINYINVPATTKSGQQIDTDIYLVDRAKLIQCNIRDITHRMRIERSLVENEARLRTLVQTIPDLIWLKDADGIYLSCNKMFERFFGAREADIVGKTDYDFVDKELADFFREYDRKAMAAGKPCANEEWLTFADDGYRGLFETIKTPMYDAGGKLIGVLGISHDITGRKQAEEEHKAHIRFLESLERIDQAIKEETDVEQMLRHILQTVFSIFDCDRTWIFYPCDPDAPTFRVPMEISRPEYPGANVLNVDVPMSPDMAQNLRDALASDDPVIYIAGTGKPINKVTAGQFGVQSQMFIALYPKMGKPWVFGMHQCSYPRIWTEEEKILFKEISRRISDGLSGVLYLHELQENEARFSEAQRLAKIGSWEWNLLTNHVWWSDETYRIFGVTPQDFVPSFETNGKFIHPDDFARYSKSFEHSLQTGEPLDIDIRLVTSDGLLKHCQAKGKLIYDDAAQPTCFLGTIMDITERKKEEQALRETEERFAAAFNASPNLIAITRMADGKIMDINEGYSKLLGYSRDESIGKTTTELSIWANQADRATFVGRLEKFGEVTDFETTLRRKNGTVVTVLDSGRTIELQGEKCLLSIAHDITERKRAEEDLQESEERFRLLSEATFEAIAIHEEGILLNANDQYFKMFGYEPGEALGREMISLTIVPESFEFVKKQITTDSLGPYESIGLRKDGTRFPIEVRTRKIKYKGRIVRFGAIRDITERKRAEAELKASENKYRLLADNVHDVIFVLDMNLKYTYISPSVKIMRGYEPEEVLKQQSIEQTLTPSSRDLALKTFSEIMELEKSGRRDEMPLSRTLQLEMRRKDGTTVWTEVNFSFIRDENNQSVGIMGVTRDITERKNSEKQLYQTLDRLKKAVGTTIQVLGTASEARDPYTAGHQKRVADLARTIATEMGLSTNTIEGIRMAGSIHDIGKLSIPAEILSKPTKLTDLEFSLIKEHPRSGYEMLKDVESPWPLAQIVYQHHERMNGTGYPRNLKGDEIIMEARIMAVADVVEAMASHRPYRPGLGIEAALDEIEKNKGILYDNVVADACLRLFREKGLQLT